MKIIILVILVLQVFTWKADHGPSISELQGAVSTLKWQLKTAEGELPGLESALEHALADQKAAQEEVKRVEGAIWKVKKDIASVE